MSARLHYAIPEGVCMPSTPDKPAKSTRAGRPAASAKPAKPGRKPLKIIGIVVAVIVGLLIVTAIVLPFVINPNDFKPRIAQLVHDKTGRTLDIEGNIKISIFPWLGVQIGPMQLSNAAGFGNMPFASINEADVHVRFLPLLRGEVQVGNIKLDGASIDLERNAAGRNNWQDMLDHLGKAPASAPAATEDKAAAGNTALDNLHIAGLQLSDTSLRWNDAQNHQQYTISNFDLDMGAFAPAQPVRLTLGLDFAGTNPAVTGHADFKGTLIADLAHRIYTADDAKLAVNASGDALPGGKLDATLIWKHIVANLQSDSIAVNQLDASAYGVTAHLDLQGKHVTRQPAFTGKLALDGFSPRAVLTALGHGNLVETRDPAALSSASAAFDFVATTHSAALQNLQLKLDDTSVSGQVTVRDFKSQALNFDLDIDTLNADRYLPPQKAATPDKPREPLDINKVSIPVRSLRSLNLDGHLAIGRIVLLGATVSKLDLGVSAHGGLVKLDPLSAALYSGTLAGRFQVDARGDTPGVSEDLTLKNVQAGALIKDMFKVERLSGGVDLHVGLQARGATVGEMRHTLDGRLEFAFSNGAYEGVNVWDSIARTYAKLKRLPAPAPAPKRTEFADVHGTATVRRGVLDNRDFVAALPYLKINGAGKVDLAESTLDYAVKAHVTGTPKVGAERDLGKLTGTTIPLRITGTFSDLSVRPDFGDALRDKAQAALDAKKAAAAKKLAEQKAAAQKKLDQQKAEAKKKADAKKAALKKKAQDKLKNLLGGGGGGA
ncbi:MAG TPA: AsmA family protein [Gammaproteobacteria bacterium]|nr:AsmA family protein [Gammaproteobacteria bacterium]